MNQPYAISPKCFGKASTTVLVLAMLSIGPSLFAQPTVRVDTPGVAFIRDNGSGRAAIEDVAGGRRFRGEAGAKLILRAVLHMPPSNSADPKIQRLVIHFRTSPSGPSLRSVKLSNGSNIEFRIETHLEGNYIARETAAPTSVANMWDFKTSGPRISAQSVLRLEVQFPQGFDSPINPGEFFLASVGVDFPRKALTHADLVTPLVVTTATPIPASQPGTILGIGLDKYLWTRATLNSQWVQVPNSGLVTGIAVMPDGTILGIGLDKYLWTRATLNSQWVQVPNSGLVTGIAVMPDGTILGIGLDKYLWTRATLNSQWVQVPDSGLVTGIAVMSDGTILGIGLDKYLWTRATLNSQWVQVPNSGLVTGIAVMPDGTILGIGLDKYLWTRATLNSQWTQVPNSGLVIGIASISR